MQRFFRVAPPSVHQMVVALEKAGWNSRQPEWHGRSPLWSILTIYRSCIQATVNTGGRVPPGGVRAVDKWPAVATVQSLAEAGHLSTAAVIADHR
jgi:hypothetical protein